MSRYSRTFVTRGGQARSTSFAIVDIRQAVKDGIIKTKEITLGHGTRLDHLAAVELGDERLWWVIAACSDIGVALQAPPGTRIIIPTDREKLKMFIT